MAGSDSNEFQDSVRGDERYIYLNGKTGRCVLFTMYFITSNPRWVKGDIYHFYFGEKKIFNIEVMKSRHGQKRRGKVKFWENQNDLVAVNYNDLQPYMVKGLSAKVRTFMDTEFDYSTANPNDRRDYQIFILFLYEIARRKKQDHPKIPNRKRTKEAMSAALLLDTSEAYFKLRKMFSSWNFRVRSKLNSELRQ